MFEIPPDTKAWLIVFHRRSTWWVEAICPGPWKHVTAVGHFAATDSWVGLSWELGRLRIAVVPHADFEKWFGEWCGEGAGILRVKSPDFDAGPWRPRLGLFCTSIVCHLLGLRHGALRPDRLWRLLVANGAEVATDGRSIPPHDQGSQADQAGTLGAGERGIRAA